MASMLSSERRLHARINSSAIDRMQYYAEPTAHKSNTQRIQRTVEDSRPVPAPQKLHAVLFLLESFAGEAENVAHRLHHAVEH